MTPTCFFVRPLGAMKVCHGAKLASCVSQSGFHARNVWARFPVAVWKMIPHSSPTEVTSQEV